MAEHNSLGALGEKLAVKFLRNNDFFILEQNKRIGKEEIDIIAEKDTIIHIIEVKSVRKGSRVRAEDNLTSQKLRHVFQTARLIEASHEYTGKRILVDAMFVEIDFETREADIRMVHNIVEE